MKILLSLIFEGYELFILNVYVSLRLPHQEQSLPKFTNSHKTSKNPWHRSKTNLIVDKWICIALHSFEK